tara:strand:+ start:892 stop:2004 length:1113 start_codon:yes stop_codon:yes gene_type:complete
MKICYLFNSSIPSHNASSLQVIKTCEGFVQLKHKVFLITPNTGLNLNIKKFYDLKFNPIRIKLNFFKNFPKGIKYYLFSFLSVFKAISLKPDLFITRNLFTLFILVILNKKVVIELHHDLSNEGKFIKFLYNNFDILNSKNIIKIIAITKAVKNFLTKELKVYRRKIFIVPSASSLRMHFSKLKNKKKYNIGYFGSLDKTKGSRFVMELSKLDKQNDYYVYGGDKRIIKQFKNHYKNKNLHLHVFVSYKNLKNHLNKMDVLVMPSNNKTLRSLGGIGNIVKYTSPLKLFDYLASGKLIIISKLKVFEEVIEKNKHCIALDLNHNKWLKVICKISKNLKKINLLKKNAFLLSKKYTYKKRAQDFLYGLNNQ